MKRDLIVAASIVASGLAGSALGPRSSNAQSSTGADVAVATDAGGTWVVRGDKVVLCRRKLIQPASNQPPEIECGRPATLP